MKFQYIGNPRKGGEGPMKAEIRGYTFTKNGEPVEVTDPVAMAKFVKNDHFLHDPAEVETHETVADPNLSAPAVPAVPKKRGPKK